MKIKIVAVTYFSVILGLTSCISDNSTLVTQDIPSLSIAGSNDAAMPIVNFNLGDPCIIHPDISYQDGNESDLRYEWSVGTYQKGTKGELEVVSHDKKLEYKFLAGGTYYAHLNVTDGKVGRSIDYQVNINRTFEDGYLLVSNDEAGNGNLAFIKTMTPEEIEAGTEQIRIEHAIERMNEGTTVKHLVGVMHATITWPETIHRILASVEDRCYFLDPNTFTVVAELKYDDVYPGFKATHFMPDNYSPYAYDAAMHKFIHMNLQYMFAYEYQYYKGQSFDDFFVNSYLSYSGVSKMPLFVKYATSEVYDFNANLGTFGSTRDRLVGKDIISAFIGLPEPYLPLTYVLTRSKEEPTKCFLHSIMSISSLDKEPGNISTIEFTVNDDIAMPAIGSRFAFSPVYIRHFYAIDNYIYVCLVNNPTPLPKKSEYAIQYPSNETITFLDVNPETEELYVATYNKTTKRGSFYIYDTKDVKVDNQGHIVPKASHKDCADKITSIFYKPSL